MALDERKWKRLLVGILFGRLAKKKLLSPKPWQNGMPTAPEFKVTDARNFVKEKTGLRALVERCGR